MQAMEKIPIDMRPSVSRRPARRPCLSVYAPNTMAPRGRIKNPAPKVMNDKHQRPKRVAGRKEGCADGGGVIAKDHEVIHLQKISAANAHHRPDFGAAIRGARHGISLWKGHVISQSVGKGKRNCAGWLWNLPCGP